MYDMLIGEGEYEKTKIQPTLPSTIVIHVQEIALNAGERIEVNAEFKGSFTKNFQGISLMPYL